MAHRLDKCHPCGRALSLEKHLGCPDPGGEGRLLYGGKLPPARHVTTGREGESRAVADQECVGVAFHDDACCGIADSTG